MDTREKSPVGGDTQRCRPQGKKRDAPRSAPCRRAAFLPVNAATHVHSTTEAVMRKVATARKTATINWG